MSGAIRLSDVRARLHCDSVSRTSGILTARWGFYYRHGRSAAAYAEHVLAAFPDATIIDRGDVDKPFRGSATVAQSSHFFVKFTLPPTNQNEETSNGKNVQ
jgi:hypothetical protein